MWRIVILIFPFLFLGCGSGKKKAVKSHFNIETYLDSVYLPGIKTLSFIKKTSINRITKDTSTVTLNLDEVKLSKILAIFYKSNIDKSAYYGFYNIDTTWHKNTLAKVRYKSTRNKLKVKELTLYFDDSEHIDSIVIYKIEEDFIQKAGKKLTLLPRGFNISGYYVLKQFNEKQTYSLEARFYQ